MKSMKFHFAVWTGHKISLSFSFHSFAWENTGCDLWSSIFQMNKNVRETFFLCNNENSINYFYSDFVLLPCRTFIGYQLSWNARQSFLLLFSEHFLIEQNSSPRCALRSLMHPTPPFNKFNWNSLVMLCSLTANLRLRTFFGDMLKINRTAMIFYPHI